MSQWSYIKGIVEVVPEGNTQKECEFNLKTLLNHLPKVAGSEQEDMYTHLVQCGGYSRLAEEGPKIQENYIIVIEGQFRDKDFKETYKAFVRWLTRLAKHIWTHNCLIQISGYDPNWNYRKEILSLDEETLQGLYIKEDIKE